MEDRFIIKSSDIYGSYKWLIKASIIGDCRVGKSSIRYKLAENDWKEDYLPTVGVDFAILGLDDISCKFQLWDLSGDPKYSKVCESYYRGMSIFIIVYDVSNKTSFESVTKYRNKITEITTKPFVDNILILLLGNKVEALGRQVSTEEGEALALKYRAFFMECDLKDVGVEVLRSKLKEVIQKFMLNHEK